MVDLRYGGASDIGVREANEDSWMARPPVFVVADGMGGHDAGEVASGVVVAEFGRLAGGDVVSTEQVAAALDACQRRIGAIGAGTRPTLGHAGTTLVGCLLVRQPDQDQPYWLVVNIGDSRAYRLDAGSLERITVDHSVVQELVDAGQISEDEAAYHPERHVVTRVLGSPEAAEPDYFLLSLETTRRVLLCSDGVSGAIPDDRIAQIMRDVAEPAEAAQALVAAAITAGGRDNATAVVIDVVGWDDDAVGATVEHRTTEDVEGPGDTLKRPRISLMDDIAGPTPGAEGMRE